jgi:hypothetical protein
VAALTPHWYAAYNEGTLGWEHNLSHPDDAFDLFMANAWIQQNSADQLAHWTDIPWLTDGGDFFYLQKLAETAKQFRGLVWRSSVNLFFHPGPQTIFLTWNTQANIPPGTDWTISSDPIGGPTPVNVPGTDRAHTLDGMENYLIYTITISSIDNFGSVISTSIRAFATDRFSFLPSIFR